jgi:diacylglycerol kinase (ATP)
MSEVKKLLFIINKYAGTGYEPQLERKIIDSCAQHRVECSIEFTAGRGHATELARKGAGTYSAVVAVGGDGTVNEVCRGLVSTPTPLGIIPKGSGNGLARHLNIPLKLSSSLQALLTGNTIAMDTFRLNGQLSVNVSGIGFDGHIANLFGQYKKRGLWGYTTLVLKEYLRYREFEVELQTENKTSKYKSFIIAVANSSQYGNNAFIAPQASVTDGLLQIARIKKIPLYRGLSFGYRMFMRKLQNNDLFNSSTQKNFTIRTTTPVSYHIDGEPCGLSDTFVIELMPGSLPVIVPANQQNV